VVPAGKVATTAAPNPNGAAGAPSPINRPPR
jgi:hypothetical protein